MHYFASLNTNYVCRSIMEIDDDTYNANVENGYAYENEYCIAIETNDTSLIYTKKYINGEWVDALPSESELPLDTRLVHLPDDKWLSNALGELATLSTTDKTSLVNAVNECFLYANNGKEAIAEAIIGVDDSITIPDGATFAQLATLIGQLGGLQVVNGSMSEITPPESIAQETGFQPKLVIIYNVGTGTANVNVGLYVSSSLLGSQVSDSYYGLGGTLTRYNYPFTITETGFTFANHGACTNLKWLAMG